jgi:hypothetical protein
MKGSPGNAFVVRTAWLAESNVWVWEMVDASSGEVTERSWPSHWAGYPSREGAEQAGVARLQEVAGPARVAETLGPPPAARGREQALPGKRQLGRSVLIVVPRTRVDLYQSLKRSFADDAKAEVVLDRRFKDRRLKPAAHDCERRKTDRRRRPDIDAQIKADRWVTVPIIPPTVDLADPDARAILFLCCSSHLVQCHKCQRGYRLGWLRGGEPGAFRCPLCGFDITPAVAAHTETCVYWVKRSGPGRKASSSSAERVRPSATSTATG